MIKGRFKNLTDVRFGRLTALKPIRRNKYGHVVWLCKCDCGVEKAIRGMSLTNGMSRSCGCLRKDTKHSYIDLTGQKFGRLKVIRRHYEQYRSKKATYYECDCDCGEKGYIANSLFLRRGTTVSCGCMEKEKRQEIRRKKAEEILRLLDEGNSKSEIAKLLGVTERCISNRLKNYKV